MCDSIQRIIHIIITVFGGSELNHGGTDIEDYKYYPQEVLQGSASDPDIWIFLSSVVFEVLYKRKYSVKFISSPLKQTVLLVGFAYVDNYDLIWSGENHLEVINSMKRVVHSCGSLMEITSGTIRTDKIGDILPTVFGNMGNRLQMMNLRI